MSAAAGLELWRSALELTAQIAAPLLVAVLAVALLIGVVQAATQIQESVLTFVPKLAVAAVVLWLSGSWMLQQLETFATRAITLSAGEQESSWSR